MKLEGEHIFNGPREDVWEMFVDPNVLASALPGTQSLEQTSENEYEGIMNIRIGPVSGKFSGKLVRSETNEPESCTLTVDGKGAPGFARGTGHVFLVDQGDGTTLMKYDGEVEVGGTLASVGQRMLDSVSKSMIRAAFDSLDKALAARIKAKSEGGEVDYQAPTESEFAASVAKDMAGGMLNSQEGRLFLYVVPAIIIMIALAFFLSRL